jgi:cytochrome P450
MRKCPQNISFGDGPHRWLGMHLARLETSVRLNAVLDRLPNLRLDPASSGAAQVVRQLWLRCR